VPAKYTIHTKPAAPRRQPVGKLGIVDWREDCSGCHNCVKRACVYGLYRQEADTLRNEIGYLDYLYQCKGCLSCVQNCTKNILTRVVNPEYLRLGDDYFSPDIVLATWFQAETGRIPVSGSGYGGPFSGPGFDSMWTDMSEIVRPTRDGIHGREYISTSVDIGRKLPRLVFAEGQLAVAPPPLLETPLPVIFDILPEHWQRGQVPAAVTQAAADLGTRVVLRERDVCQKDKAPDHADQRDPQAGTASVPDGARHPGDGDAARHIIPLLDAETPAADARYASAPLVMIEDGPEVMARVTALKAARPERIVAIRLPASPAVAGRVLELTRGGAEVLHLVFDSHGRESPSPLAPLPEGEGRFPPPVTTNHQPPATTRHARDVLRDCHGTLVRQGIRDEVTLVASGGIALAEHVAKAIICGADLVAVDVPLVLALECRLCGECLRGEPCPIALEEVAADYGAQRIHNLIGAWHQQLIEVLGAMGIREVRRLRGETGRAMFFEDLERETFGRLFGKRKDSQREEPPK
jgi:Pyruvate/2-oxoacid:ferredoxin oxidoreductase delta subunit